MADSQIPAGDADLMAQSAYDCLQRDQLDAAEAFCRQALAIRPDHADSLGVLGGVLHALGRYSEAEAVYADLIERAPDDATHWMNLGTVRRALGNFDAALAAFARAAELGCRTADFYYNLGLTHLDRLDYESARAVLQRAMDLAPDDAEIRFEYARACNESNHTAEAVAALENWRGLATAEPELSAKISQQLLAMGETQPAKDALERLARSTDIEPRAALTLVQILERMNRVTEASALLARIMSDPGARSLGIELERTMAQLAQRESRHEEACRLFAGVIRRTTELHKQHFELFPLAQSLDALGHYDKAFEALNEAHRSQLAYLRLSAPLIAARGAPPLLITQYGCDPADVAAWDDSGAPSVDESPIFIVGFPRSGTTLLELTLDAHPLLASMDEQPFLQKSIDEMMSMGCRYPEGLSSLTAEQLNDVRGNYWERARRKVRLDGGQRLVDKNPLNLLRLPAIRRLFPNARILLVIRHPFDVLLSCYMQHFTAPDFALLCADLPTLASGHRRCFDFWFEQAALLRPAAHAVRYETFVSDFDRQVRGIAEFLELPWDESMLAPGSHAANKGYISTPSYSQVMQPVSSKSVGRWQAYARHFAPISHLLEPSLARWGYSAHPQA